MRKTFDIEIDMLVLLLELDVFMLVIILTVVLRKLCIKPSVKIQ